MSIIFSFYHTFLFQPIFNLLVLLYQVIPGGDFGVAVIVLTLLFRFAFYPLSAKAVVAQKKLSELQPKTKEIQEKFKNDKDQQTKALLELYKKERINPFAGILPILVQLPILIALYRVFWQGLDVEQLQYLYTFVANPGVIDPSFLGLVNLGERSFVLATMAGIFQFFQGRQMTPKKQKDEGKKKDFAASFQKQMLYAFPFLTFFIVSQLPSAIGLYWITTTIFSIGQQWYIKRKNPST